MNKWIRKRTGEVVEAVQWLPGETDNDVRNVIISNVEDGQVPVEEIEGFVHLTMAVIDAYPGDWIIAEPSSTKALTPQAFDQAYEPFTQ